MSSAAVVIGALRVKSTLIVLSSAALTNLQLSACKHLRLTSIILNKLCVMRKYVLTDVLTEHALTGCAYVV